MRQRPLFKFASNVSLVLLLLIAIPEGFLPRPKYVGRNPQFRVDLQDLELCKVGEWCARLPRLVIAIPTGILVYMRWGNAVNRLLQSRDVSGRCAKCGYDLRATPSRCPECGTVPPSANG